MDMSDSPSKSPKPVNSPTYVPAATESNVSGSAGGDSTAAGGVGGSLFVGKLAFDCRTRELEDLFGKYGRITRCDIKRGK